MKEAFCLTRNTSTPTAVLQLLQGMTVLGSHILLSEIWLNLQAKDWAECLVQFGSDAYDAQEANAKFPELWSASSRITVKSCICSGSSAHTHRGTQTETQTQTQLQTQIHRHKHKGKHRHT